MDMLEIRMTVLPITQRTVMTALCSPGEPGGAHAPSGDCSYVRKSASRSAESPLTCALVRVDKCGSQVQMLTFAKSIL